MPPSGRSRPSLLAPSAPTPHFRRPAETPFGKIQPVFDGFALAETSWASDSTVSNVTPRVKAPHKTPETKRRRRDELYTPAPPAAEYHSPPPAPHQDDLFARRLADSIRRAPLAPLPDEQLQDAPSAAALPAHDSVSKPAVVKPKMSSRAARARAAGIPTLAARSIAIPPSRVLPPLRRPVPQPRYDLPSSQAPGVALSASRASVSHRPHVDRENCPPSAAGPSLRSTMSQTLPSTSSYPSLSSANPPQPYEQSPSTFPVSRDVLISQACPSADTPASTKSIAASAATLEGRSELWDLSMGTPTGISINRRRPAQNLVISPYASSTPARGERSIRSPLSMGVASPMRGLAPTMEDRRHPVPAVVAAEDVPRKLSFNMREEISQRLTPPRLQRPQAQSESPAEEDSRDSGGILGFLTGLFLNPPAPPKVAPKRAPPPSRPALKSSRPGPSRSAVAARMNRDETRVTKTAPKGRAPEIRVSDSRDENRIIRAAPKVRATARAISTRPSAQQVSKLASHPPRQPLCETRGDVINQATALRQKRKQPPSPVKSSRPAGPPPVRGSAPPSYARPTASRMASQPAANVQSSTHTHTTARRPRPVSRITPFVAQALARLPKPGEGVTPAAKPVSIADHERARELAIRKAVFERAGKAELPAPPPEEPIQRSAPPPAPAARIPGEATRRRAEMQALNKERRDRKAAEEARVAAEEARIRAEIEAEFDRQARRATVFRPNPLPEMYHRR
ncbi:hypothetical protein CC85DRAFT_288946 [Cutaneotrichosporon oleaginosum]|uniref:TPX2 C-terminal domain-containing protein n=1 Tax=Cutaneotrichosporon oleaginosum TaxID=879819 RepID=A0A0J0XD67_9TREE|nr:uncharacterized protein CC85DRAFT_288946 [Cutaneotrichosporon oleaginosum]KLT39025.1 hypothetical protein CC85DRAFT_288946 [Cutaneotrichosporon oleaginosum]TXT03964.1 hypothetical protein COLE_07661 [Cutaneotrichosporon oleaginosum]